MLISGFSKNEDCGSEESSFWVKGPESAVGDDEQSVVECPGKRG